MKQRSIALLLAATLLAMLLAGCGGSATSTEAPTSEASPASESTVEAPAVTPEASEAPVQETESVFSAAEETPAEPAVTINYPLEGDDLSLSYFVSFPSNLTSYMSTYNDHPGFQALEEATGVSINFTEVGMENSATQFSLMVASDDFTDLVGGFGDMYVGGATAAYEADLILDINEYLPDNAPDYLAAIDTNPSYQDIVYEMDGTMLAFYGLYLYDYTAVSNGLFIRQDWLDDLNLETPVTYDDWHDVLSAFVTEKGATAALLLPMGSESRSVYAGGYQTAGYSSDARMSAGHFFQRDGVVTSSLIDENYHEYLTMLHQWYEEGLIYGDFFSNDTRDTLQPLLLDNQVGIFDGKVDYITRFNGTDADGAIRLTGITCPVREEGDEFGFGRYMTKKSSVSITTACQSPELALQWLNYLYTEDGILLANYGQEGVSFEYNANGEPEFTDVILHNEDPELQFGNVTRLYLLDEVLPTIYDQTRELAAYSDAEQAAIALWSDTQKAIYTMPSLTLTTEQNEAFAAALVDVETYASECIIKFITGDMDLAQWDSFVDTIKGMGIETCIDIYQEVLDAQAA